MVATILVRRMTGGTVAPRAGVCVYASANVSASATRVASKTRCTSSGPRMSANAQPFFARERVPAQDHAQPGRVHERSPRAGRARGSADPAACSRSSCRVDRRRGGEVELPDRAHARRERPRADVTQTVAAESVGCRSMSVGLSAERTPASRGSEPLVRPRTRPRPPSGEPRPAASMSALAEDAVLLETSPSALRRPPPRRSQIMSQWTALSFVPPVSGYERPTREVDGAADLLVEQDRADRAVDAGVRADAELAEPAGAGVGVERRQQVGARRARRARRRPGRRGRSSSTPATSTPRGLDGIVKRMRALGRVLVRPGEDLARRHVAAAVGVDPGAAARRAGAGRCPRPRCAVSRARARRSIRRAWRARSSAHAAAGSGAVEERRAPHEGGELRRAHAAPAARRRASATASRTSAAACAASRSGARARAARAIRAGSTPASARGVLRRLDRQRRRRPARPRRARRARSRRGARRARPPTSASSWPGSVGRRSGQAPRVEQLALEGEQQRGRERRRAHDDLLARPARRGSSRTAARAKAAGSGLTVPRARGSARRGARAARRGSSAARPRRRSG